LNFFRHVQSTQKNDVSTKSYTQSTQFSDYFIFLFLLCICKRYETKIMEKLNCIFIPTSDGMKRIEIDEIIYLAAENSYTKIFMTNDKCEKVANSLKIFEETLGNSFFRIHNSYLINGKHIEAILKTKPKKIAMKGNIQMYWFSVKWNN